jgi:hypothetical protein
MYTVQVQLLLMFALFAYLSKSKALYSAFGFNDSQPVLIGTVYNYKLKITVSWKQCCGSMTFWYGSGSANPFL